MQSRLCFLCVDFQKDFADPKGINFNHGTSVSFVQEALFPYLKKQHALVNEIISDYRLPRGKSTHESCVPGTSGFESLLPAELRNGKPWIKCMHNPIWIRDGIGEASKKLGSIRQDPMKFNEWLKRTLTTSDIVLFGLTADCCVLQTAAELYFRGYNVYVLYEATDPMNERLSQKDVLLSNSTLSLYAKTIHFEELQSMMRN